MLGVSFAVISCAVYVAWCDEEMPLLSSPCSLTMQIFFRTIMIGGNSPTLTEQVRCHSMRGRRVCDARTPEQVILPCLRIIVKLCKLPSTEEAEKTAVEETKSPAQPLKKTKGKRMRSATPDDSLLVQQVVRPRENANA